MRVVLDTNVLLSAILFAGTPGRILDAWRAGQVELVMAPDIVDEYVRAGDKLEERYPDPDVDIQPIIALVVQHAKVVPINLLPTPGCDDPDDDKLLARTLVSGTEIVVSGDKKLRAVSDYEGIRVLTPRQLVEQCLPGSGAV